MRILILATDIYTRGGVARYTATLAAALSGLPAHVDVLPLLGDSRLRGNRDEIRGQSSSLEGSYRILTPTTNRLTLSAKVRHAVRALRQAGSRYDLVICSHLSQALIAAMIRLRHATPYMVVAHGSEAWGRLPTVKRLALRRARAVLAVSVYTARTLAGVHRIPPARVKVIYNAIPDELVQALTSGRGGPWGRPAQPRGLLLQPGESGRPQARLLQPMLLSVASLKPEHAYKGVDTVIQALPQIAAAVPEVRYVVAGAGDDRARLERLASTLGVRDRVIFAGEVSDAKLASLYHASEAFVLPSRTSQRESVRGEGEGFGRVYVEAALAGKPVVGSTDGGAAEAVLAGRTGLLVDPRSVTGVASAVIRLLQSPDCATSLGAEGRRWALERFTVAAMRRALAHVLCEDLQLRESVVRRPVSVVRGASAGRVGPTTNAPPRLTTDNGQLTQLTTDH